MNSQDQARQQPNSELVEASRLDQAEGAALEEGAESAAPGDEWCVLKLYVAGQSPKSLRAVSNLKRLCAEQLDPRYEIEIVDLVQNPRLAAGDEIVAIPTLVRRLPEPMRKVIGDLSDSEKVIVGLQLLPKTG